VHVTGSLFVPARSRSGQLLPGHARHHQIRQEQVEWPGMSPCEAKRLATPTAQ